LLGYSVSVVGTNGLEVFISISGGGVRLYWAINVSRSHLYRVTTLDRRVHRHFLGVVVNAADERFTIDADEVCVDERVSVRVALDLGSGHAAVVTCQMLSVDSADFRLLCSVSADHIQMLLVDFELVLAH
jgi:hypothetical protein